MKDRDKIERDILKILGSRKDGAKLSRIQDWMATRPANEVMQGLSFLREQDQRPFKLIFMRKRLSSL
jgi:hypothetical protein